MTTYSVDLKTETQTSRTGLGIDYTKGGALTAPTQPTPNSKSYGSNSRFNPPSGATQAKRMDGSGNYGNPMRTHVDVKATEVPGSKHQTLGNKARVAASNAKGALGKTAGMAGRVGGRVSPGVGINAKGDIDFGLRAGGAGVSLSVKGDISLGVPGLSATVSPRNGDTTVDIGFGGMTIESTRVGCSITVTVKLAGKIINQDTRQADDCVEPEPTPEPTPSPSPTPEPPKGNTDIENTDDVDTPNPAPFTPPTGYTGWICPMYLERRKDSTSVQFEYSNNNGSYYSYFMTTTGITREHGFAPAGYFYSLSANERNRVKFSGNNAPYESQSIYYKNIDGNDYYYIIRFWMFVLKGGTPPKPWKAGGYVLSQGVPPHTWQTQRYYDKLYSDIYGEDRYSFGYFSDAKCFIIENPYHPNAANPYQTKPRAIPPMDNDKCCELNNRIYEMLGGDEFFKEGLTIPCELFIPGGKGSFKMVSYNEIMNVIFRTFSHRTPGEIEFTITDTNKGKKGNQALQYRSINAQGYFTNLMKTVSELNYENDDQLNVLVRLGVITTQLMKMVVVISESLKSILKYFGIPTKDYIEKVDVPFDLSLNGALSKGFKSREDLQKELLKIVDKDTEEAIEGILDKFLDEWQMPVKVQKLRGSGQGGDFWFFLRNGMNKR